MEPGTVTISGSGTLGRGTNSLDVEGGTLDLGGTTQRTDGVTLNGGAIQNGGIFASGTIALNDGTVGAKLSGESNVVVNGAAGDVVVMTNPGFGAGHLEVKSGTLEVGDASHPDAAILVNGVTVDSRGILRGHGTITSLTTNHGTIYPGGSTGVLTIIGDYVQASDGTLEIEIGPGSNGVVTAGRDYDQLAVEGTASLAGTVIFVPDGGT